MRLLAAPLLLQAPALAPDGHLLLARCGAGALVARSPARVLAGRQREVAWLAARQRCRATIATLVPQDPLQPMARKRQGCLATVARVRAGHDACRAGARVAALGAGVLAARALLAALSLADLAWGSCGRQPLRHLSRRRQV